MTSYVILFGETGRDGGIWLHKRLLDFWEMKFSLSSCTLKCNQPFHALTSVSLVETCEGL